MQADVEVDIDVDEESYEIKALKAYLAKAIRFSDPQASLGLSRSRTYKIISEYEENGADTLRSKKTGKSNRAHPAAYRNEIMSIVQDRYADFGPKFACEKLLEDHRIRISVETLRIWMRNEGIWTDRASRKPRIFSPRKPRERRGELIQIDGSYHRWFEKRGPEACLLVFIDDATSELMLLMLVDHESSYNYMLALRRYIEMHGRPLALFADRHSTFRATNPKDDGTRTPTQFARVCSDLSIQIICAKTPQAKGRVERANRTLQDRLIKEMRLRNISTIETANVFLEKYRLIHG